MPGILLAAAAAVAGIGDRPPALTGAQPQAYARWLHARVVSADRAFGGQPCAGAESRAVSGRTLNSTEAAPTHVARRAGSPVYLERVRLTGCGRAVTHNIQVVRTRRGGWDGIGLLPGEPRASPRQQNEAMQRMATVALNGPPGLPCPSSEALRTMVHGEVRVTASAGAGWSERWPLRLCGQDRTLEVRFPGASASAVVSPAWGR